MGYEDYDVKAALYDDTRVAVGMDIVVAHLTRIGPLAELSLLDAGCGTGNYLRALQGSVGRITGIDASAGMLGQARVKLGTGVRLMEGSITELPFPDAHFDAVLSTQVLHHLATSESDGAFPGVAAFFSEAARVIRPDGRIVLNTVGHAQLRDGLWWAALIPTAIDRMAARIPDIPKVEHMLRDAGFEVEVVVADLLGVVQGSDHADPNGPLRESWRDGDSTWTLAPKAELDGAMARIRNLRERGELEEFISSREQLRIAVGQTTFVVARR